MSAPDAERRRHVPDTQEGKTSDVRDHSTDPLPTDAMSGGITIDGLTKRYGAVTAVDDLTFAVEPGVVTGFLGPNGAGKTTTLRMLLGLVTPTAGRALIDGHRYAELPEPRRAVGAVLEATGFHPGRSGRDHLRILARAGGVPASRVEEVLDRVGLGGSGHRRVGGYSLGMRQRLGLAAALLGEPGVLVLDEPANGLDPAGVADLRELLRGLAEEGRTVLMSSHVLSEVAQTVDRVVIVAGGTLRYSGPLADLTAKGETLEAAFLRLTSDPDTDPATGATTAPAHR
ncbi:ABC transporter ATP-binding protein [Streptomyces sp. NPDC057877]|uniref:ABC transporter ATP-binding protein n=1 Tax=Streptomyces sp. NPDC057877 TaxID=3346269 RepID=UPI0036A985D9